ncbi:MAG: PAS domain S-box protein [Myxococcota bacterium]|nr:PAS domain S-box protein [Myxococcota bacterium]
MSPTSTEPGSGPLPGRVPNANDGETIARTLLEKAPILVYVVDLNFKVVLMNRELREVTGWDTSHCGTLDRLLESFYPDPAYREPIREIHLGWARSPSEQVRDTVMVLSTRDGRQRSISWTTARLRVGKGQVRGYIALGIDVTTRRNLEHWVNLFQQTLVHLGEVLVLTDPTGHILAWSGGATRLLGHSEAEVQGKIFSDLMGPAYQEELAPTIAEALNDQGTFHGAAVLPGVQGQLQSVEMSQSILRDPADEVLAHLIQLSPSEDATATAEERNDLLQQELQDALTRAEAAKGEAVRLREEVESQGLRLEEERAESREEISREVDSATQALEQELAETREQAAQAQAESEDRLAESEARAADRVSEAEALAEMRVAEAEAKALEEVDKERQAVQGQIAQALQDEEVRASEREAQQQESWDRRVDAHREELAELQSRLDEQRLQLEEQLTRDILATEERAEAKVAALLEQQARARKEWDDATAIERAEGAARADHLKEQLSDAIRSRRDEDGSLSAEQVLALLEITTELAPTGSSTGVRAPSDDSADDLDPDDLELDLDDDTSEAHAPAPEPPATAAATSDGSPLGPVIDAPPPVSPVMVATASELQAHRPSSDQEPDSELELPDPIDQELEIELPEPEEGDELELDIELELEPTEDGDDAPGTRETAAEGREGGPQDATAPPKKKKKKKRKKRD